MKSKIIIGCVLLAAAFVMMRGLQWSRKHVDHITASVGHSLNCTSCHFYTDPNSIMAKWMDKEYVLPFNLVTTSDGKYILVTAQEENALYIIELIQKSIVAKVKVGDHPHSVVVNKAGTTAYVSNQWSDNVFTIQLPGGNVTDTIETGTGPSGLSLSEQEDFLYIVNTYSSDVSIVNLATGKEEKRLSVGRDPTGITLSPDGRAMYVASRRSSPENFRDVPKVEVSIISTSVKKVVQRKIVERAHIMENIAFTPDGDFAIFTLVKPKNLVPAVQVENGWMINFGIGIIKPGSEKVYQLLLDEPNSFYPDPYDIVVSRDGRKAFVSHSGIDYISVIDIEKLRGILEDADHNAIQNIENDRGISSRFVIKRIKTGPNPKGMALSPNGTKLYYAEMLADKIGIVDIESLEVIDHIDLGENDKTTMRRIGARMFNHAGHTFQDQYSCYTCHPDGSEDGLTYDMATNPGKDLSNVQTLRELANTSPFKWNGKNVSVYMQCGMRFSKFVTRSEPFSQQDLDALVAYITCELKHPPNMYADRSGKLTESQERGKVIFEREKTNEGKEIPGNNRCITCHPPSHYTDRRLSDTGTAKESDIVKKFDSPKLNNVYESAPYLHDGSAASLEEIWTKHNDHDQHGVANDLTKNQLNDLIEFLKSLGPANNYKNIEP